MQIIFIIITLFSATFSITAQANTSTDYPSTLENQGITLQLNGVGLREKWFIDVYSAALYLENRNTNANKIITSEQATALKLTMLRDVAGEDMSNAIKEGFSNNAVSEDSSLQPKIAKFLKVFGAEASEGNRYLFFYTPNVGTQVYINGTHSATIKGIDFKQALFSIWLGANPAQTSLKKQLLSNVKD